MYFITYFINQITYQSDYRLFQSLGNVVVDLSHYNNIATVVRPDRFVNILTLKPLTTQTTHSFEEMPNAHMLQQYTTQIHRDLAGERKR